MKIFVIELLLALATPFYSISKGLFQIFFALAQGELISGNDYADILENIYLVIGIVMLFSIAFSLLKMLVNPDDEKSGISNIKRIIINFITSALIIIMLPTFFGFMFDVQSSLVGQNVIGKLFGFSSGEKFEENIKMQSYEIVNTVFLAFFDCEDSPNCRTEILDEDNAPFATTIAAVNENGKFVLYHDYAESVVKKEIHFDILLSSVCGALLAWIIASFCLDMAVRYVKLIFFQIIAPIPVLFRVFPGELSETFNEWLRKTFACYFEVYVRLFVVYIALWLAKYVSYNISADSFGLARELGVFAKIFIYFGLFTFMKQAPALISQLTGIDSGNLKLGIREKLADGGVFAAGAIVGGGLTAGVRNAVAAKQNGKGFWKGASSTIAGITSGAFRAGRTGLGAKSFKDMSTAAGTGARGATEARDKRAIYKSRHGNNLAGVMLGHAGDAIYNVGRWAGYNNLDSLVAQQKTINQIQSERKAIDTEAMDIIMGDLAKGKTAAQTAHYDIGGTYSMDELRRLQAQITTLSSSPTATADDIAEAEREFSNYKKAWADALANVALQGQRNWNGESEKLRAELSKLRMAADSYRETIARNYNTSYVSGLSGATDILDKEKDLSMKHDALDAIKDKMKIEQIELSKKINEIQQKEEDSK